MRVVVAPDKFKGSLTAAQVAARVAAGLARRRPRRRGRPVPVADGGDGTLEAALSAGYRRVPVAATGRRASRWTPPTPSATASP